jgi:hypothetical protein
MRGSDLVWTPNSALGVIRNQPTAPAGDVAEWETPETFSKQTESASFP